MAEKTTNWIVLFHRFDKEDKFLSARLFDFCIKVGKESSVFHLLASFCQYDYKVWQRQRKELKEYLDITDDRWEILELLLGDLCDSAGGAKTHLACFARVD